MSECSEGQRLSGALSGFHWPGLVVVPLRLRWEFPEPVRVRRCGQRVCASFLTSLNSEKKKKDMKYHNAQSVLLPFWKNDPSLWLLLFRPSYLPDWDKARQQAEATPHFFWYGHIFLFCAVFYFFFLCVLFSLLHNWNTLQNIHDEALPMKLLCISLWISPSWQEYLLFWSLLLLLLD